MDLYQIQLYICVSLIISSAKIDVYNSLDSPGSKTTGLIEAFQILDLHEHSNSSFHKEIHHIHFRIQILDI